MRPTMRPTVPDRPPEPTGSRPAPDQMRSSVQPSQILHAIRRNLVACLVILLVCILAGLGVALATKPVAAATTTLGIQPKSKETPSFSTQAKDLMPTLVELSTSPKVLDPAAANLNMETTDLSDALTVTNPPETLVLSITAKAGSKQEAVDMAQATADSLNKELSSGELLGKQALGMTTSTTSPATTANTTMERPGAQAAAISGLLLGLLASVSYAMFRHRRDSGHSGDSGSEGLPGRTAAALNALRQKTSDLLRPSRPPAQPQVQAQPPYQYQQIPAPTSPEVPVAPAPGAMATQSASSSMPSPVPAPSFSTPRSQQQTTAMPAISDSAYSAAQPVLSAQEPARAPAPPPSSVSPVSTTSSTRSPVSMSAASLSSASGGAAPTQSSAQASAPDPAHSFASGITSALQRQRAYQPAPVTPAGTASSQSAPDATASYRHAPLPPPLPTPADLTVPASPSIAVQPYTTTPSSGSHRFPGAPDGPTRRSTALPTGQTVSASSGSSASPASSAASVGSSYHSPPAPAPASSSTGSSATPATGRRRASAPSVPTRRRITSPSADRPVAATGWQDASSLPTTTSRRRVQPVPSAPEPPVAAEASRGAVRKQDSASGTGSSSSPSTSMRQQAPSRQQTLARRRRMSKPRLTLVTPLSEESSIEQTRHLAPVPTSASGRHRSPDPPDAPPPPPPPSIQPGQQMASASSAAAAPRSAPAPGASAASAGRRAQSTGRSW